MNKKLSEKSFIFYGINFIVGFGFIVTIFNLIKTGSYSLLIFAITSLIAAGIMLAFARGTQYFGKKIGGSYIYAKEAFPKQKWFWFLNGWNQFMQAPLFSASTPLFFSSIVGLFVKNDDYKYLLQIGSLVFFIILTIMSALSLNVSKRIIFWTGIVKWVVFAFIFFVVIYLVATQPTPQLFVGEKSKEVTPFLIVSSILSFIYAYGGVEGLAGLSTNVKTKKFRKILLYIFGLVIAIYLVFFLLFTFVPEISSKVNTSNYVAGIMQYALGISGLIIFTIGLLFRQMTSTIFSMVYYSKTVVPLSLDGFLPKSFAKIAKNGEHKNAVKFVTIITILAMILLTIIPTVLNLEDSFGTILNAGNLVFFILYLIAIFSIFVISIKKREFKIPLWEKIIYVATMILISAVVLITFFPPILNEAYKPSELLVALSYIGFMVLGFVVWGLYLVYKRINPINKYATNYSQLIKNSSFDYQKFENSGIKNVVDKLFADSFKTQNNLILLTNQNDTFKDYTIKTLAEIIQQTNNENELPKKEVYKLNVEKLLYLKKDYHLTNQDSFRKINKILYKLFYTKENNNSTILYIENIDLLLENNSNLVTLLKRVKAQTNIKIIATIYNQDNIDIYNSIFQTIQLDELNDEQKLNIVLKASNKIASQLNLILDQNIVNYIQEEIVKNTYIGEIINHIDTVAATISAQNEKFEETLFEYFEQKTALEYDKIKNKLKDTTVLDQNIDKIEENIFNNKNAFENEKTLIVDLIQTQNMINEYYQKIKDYEKDELFEIAYNVKSVILPELNKKQNMLLNKVSEFQYYKAVITNEMLMNQK